MTLTNKMNRRRFGKILYLAALALFLIYMFLTTTMFSYAQYWPDHLEQKLAMLALLALGILIAAEDPTQNRRTSRPVLKFICLFFISGSMLYSWFVYQQGMLFVTAVLIMGASFVDFRSILKTYLIVEIPMTALTIAAALSGRIENLTYHQKSHGYTSRMAFGFVYPTDFCAHLLFIAIALVWIRGRKISILETGLIALMAAVSYTFCYARTTSMLLILLIIAVVLQKAGYKRAQRRSQGDIHPEKKRRKSGILRGLLLVCAFWVTPFAAVFSVAGTWFYNPDSFLLKKINSAMTGRLLYGQTGMRTYGIRPWGTYVELRGAGGTTEKVQNYFMLDNSYVSILVQMGYMVLLAVIFLMILNFLAEWKKRAYMHIFLLALILLTCIMEQHLIELWYNPFLLLAGEACDTLFPAKTGKSGPSDER